MNEYLSLICVISAIFVVWMAGKGLVKAQKLDRNGRSFILPIFMGTATVILFGLNFIDRLESDRTPRDVYMAMMLLNFGYAIAVCLLLAPHYHKRKNGIRR